MGVWCFVELSVGWERKRDRQGGSWEQGLVH
jgi:hypothetical protein